MGTPHVSGRRRLAHLTGPSITLGAIVFLPGLAQSPAGTAQRAPSASERIESNGNAKPAGTIENGVLTVRLEARPGMWHPDSDSEPGMEILAFGEEGMPMQVPGPLIRVAQGTEVRASIRNRGASTLVVHGLYNRDATLAVGADTFSVAPDQIREVRFVARTPGTFFYWAGAAGAAINTRVGMESQLNGAFIVDPAGATASDDRIMVISAWVNGPPRSGGPGRIAINGKSWPHTERLTYMAGDSIRWRVINAGALVHPMHLHGFYFDVNSRGSEGQDSIYAHRVAPRRAVTERMQAGRTMTMTWVPERTGNWIFHCHDNVHLQYGGPLQGERPATRTAAHMGMNHALEMMAGPVIGVHVLPRAGMAAASEPTHRRRLRLLVQTDPTHTEAEPALGYVLQEAGKPSLSAPELLPGPTIVLKRGEPVSIMVVNQLQEPTAVHWHGIELESYFDGVAGFAGQPGRIAPAIAPADSFDARFTPPRAGTFIYHSHIDEVRQPMAGLTGALVVIDPETPFDPATDLVLLVTTPRRAADRPSVVLLNGTSKPPAREMRVGTRYRLRFINIHTSRPSMRMELRRDAQLLTWRAIAKDGADLAAELATVRPASQQMGNGETYDFEFIPGEPGDIRITISTGNGILLTEMPIRVRE